MNHRLEKSQYFITCYNWYLSLDFGLSSKRFEALQRMLGIDLMYLSSPYFYQPKTECSFNFCSNVSQDCLIFCKFYFFGVSGV